MRATVKNCFMNDRDGKDGVDIYQFFLFKNTTYKANFSDYK